MFSGRLWGVLRGGGSVNPEHAREMFNRHYNLQCFCSGFKSCAQAQAAHHGGFGLTFGA